MDNQTAIQRGDYNTYRELVALSGHRGRLTDLLLSSGLAYEQSSQGLAPIMPIQRVKSDGAGKFCFNQLTLDRSRFAD